MTLLLATNNEHKVGEMRAILQGVDASLSIVTLGDVHNAALDIEETGATLEENAYIKARAFFEVTGLACIADDTGLEIDALQGAPGVRTARFAGDQATSSDNVKLVLEKLHNVPVTHRQARFRTVMCYVDDKRTLFAEGRCEGSIALAPAGQAGFGYDPIFVPDGYSHTFAELDAAVKNSISHRALALRHCAEMLHRIRTTDEVSDLHDSAAQHLSPEVGTHAERRSLLCYAAGAAAMNNQVELADGARRFMAHGHDPQQMYEALLQTYLFAGFPAALEALSTFSVTLAQQGLQWYAESDENYDLRSFYERGTQTCKRIYTSVYTSMRERLSLITPHLDNWMIIEGYGKTLSRPQLDLCTRELITITMLGVMGWERQLYSHLRGALNIGASEEECLMALNCVLRLRDQEVFSRALEVWNRVRSTQE